MNVDGMWSCTLITITIRIMPNFLFSFVFLCMSLVIPYIACSVLNVALLKFMWNKLKIVCKS